MNIQPRWNVWASDCGVGVPLYQFSDDTDQDGDEPTRYFLSLNKHEPDWTLIGVVGHVSPVPETWCNKPIHRYSCKSSVNNTNLFAFDSEAPLAHDNGNQVWVDNDVVFYVIDPVHLEKEKPIEYPIARITSMMGYCDDDNDDSLDGAGAQQHGDSVNETESIVVGTVSNNNNNNTISHQDKIDQLQIELDELKRSLMKAKNQ
ncbi:hypothetical protein SAMD00019534_031410 [Acytostelium subglobosum LB1]|uniref:hypothetical protein n=1 Tax=Acytostelium subglobosum LB1 TaxID=1410327 RepID=UPI00064514FF|nr:hypothetical protein SAMD00019534_031410 [Acytostelium subglobosum LB1]GAM19966.1 hypothetical protein SAMD00019534_031410 [Acytostelium subglobosum LB1]|eukprot:XP_012756728.1 hypothetical protein SAMD00019534_031410 [Acytostelium subglobosum LB1]